MIRQKLYFFLSFLLLFFGIFAFFTEKSTGASIRHSKWDGKFYPADRKELVRVIDGLKEQAQSASISIPENSKLKAIILPHAGYIYSGLTAAHASIVLSENQFSKVVVLGPDHRIGFKNCAVSNAEYYQTPLGLVPLHKDTKRLLKRRELFQTVPASDQLEHSIEVLLPFLQRFLGKFELIPVVVGDCQIDLIHQALDEIIDDNTLLVISSDLSHYLPYSHAVEKDRQTIHSVMTMENNRLLLFDNCACGKNPILILMKRAQKYNWHPVLLNYTNSGDTAGDRKAVVGYTAIAFFGEKTMQNKKKPTNKYNEKQGQALVDLARKTIAEKLDVQIPGNRSKASPVDLSESCFQERHGTFVTIKTGGQLRGCIGSLETLDPITVGVKKNAINAAFHDPRFSPLTISELDQIDIEVSILTRPQPLEYRDGNDLVKKLRVNVDGVIIRKGPYSATFLPQVWEQLPKPEIFLTHLCQKAGLPGNTWQDDILEVLTYQVQYFEEKR